MNEVQLAAVRQDVRELLEELVNNRFRRCPICGDASHALRHYEGFACRRLIDALEL